MKTNTAIAIVNKSVTPPPRKAEILEALAMRMLAQQQEARAKWEADIEVAKKAFDAAKHEDFESGTFRVISIGEVDYQREYKGGKGYTGHLESLSRTTIIAPSDKTRKAYLAWDKLRSNEPEVQDLSEIRATLRLSLIHI